MYERDEETLAVHFQNSNLEKATIRQGDSYYNISIDCFFLAKNLGSLTSTKIFIQFLLFLFFFFFFYYHMKYISRFISDYVKASLPMCLRDRIGRLLAIEPGLVICKASSSPAVLCHTSAYTFLLIQSQRKSRTKRKPLEEVCINHHSSSSVRLCQS